MTAPNSTTDAGHPGHLAQTPNPYRTWEYLIGAFDETDLEQPAVRRLVVPGGWLYQTRTSVIAGEDRNVPCWERAVFVAMPQFVFTGTAAAQPPIPWGGVVNPQRGY